LGLGNYWPFDEGQGVIAHDVISHQNGTLTNFKFNSSDGWRPGWTGKAGDYSIQFDGVEDYINLGNYTIPATSSISAWVNVQDFTGTPGNLAFYILGAESEGNLASGTGIASGVEYGTVTYVEGDGSVWITDRDALGDVSSVHTAAGVVSEGKWNQITFLRNTVPVASPLSPVPSGLESIYVNGVLCAQGIMADTYNNPPAPGAIGMGFPLTTSSGPAPLGGDPPVMAPDYSDGLIDDVRVYNRLLTATATAVGQAAGGEVSALYAAPPTIPGDATLDGTVDVNDLTIVLAHYNQTGMTWTTGDFTGSGTVDVSDLTIVLANYNQSSSAAGVAAVPEPSSLLAAATALIGLLACLGRRWKS
jgi:hypothetical protein